MFGVAQTPVDLSRTGSAPISRAVLAASVLGAAAFYTATFAALFWPGSVVLLKGRPGLFWAGVLLLSLVWLVGMFRLSRLNSFWARRFYGLDKLRKSELRYPHLAQQAPGRIHVIGAALVFVCPLVLGPLVASV